MGIVDCLDKIEKKYNIGRSTFYRYRDILFKPEEKPNPYNSLEKAISPVSNTLKYIYQSPATLKLVAFSNISS